MDFAQALSGDSAQVRIAKLFFWADVVYNHQDCTFVKLSIVRHNEYSYVQTYFFH